LENFIAEAKQKYPASEFNAIKIYFIRYSVNDINRNIEKEKSDNFSVPSLAFVPIKNADPTTWTGEDFKLENEKIFVLPFCNPKGPEDETGICPPKCGKGGKGDNYFMSIPALICHYGYTSISN
jgi:hypothetical protein